MGDSRVESSGDRQVVSGHEVVAAGSNAAAVPAGAQQLLALQRTAGNRAVAALLAAAQPKLRVGAVDDPAEREADAVAKEVLARLRAGAPDGPPADAPPADRRPEESLVQPERGALRRLRRRHATGGAEGSHIGSGGGDLDAGAEAQLASLRAGGSPVPGLLRRQMEGAFDADFGAVRLHRGPASEALNDTMGAAAFTVGNDIFFGSGTPSLEQPSGQRLLAHELTHTLQQGEGSSDAGPHAHQDADVPERAVHRAPSAGTVARRSSGEVVRRTPTPPVTTPPTTPPSTPPTTPPSTVGEHVKESLKGGTPSGSVSGMSVSGTKTGVPGRSLTGSKDLYGESEKEGLIDSLDIAKVELRFTPADIKLTEKELGKISSDVLLSYSLNAIKATGKLDVSYGKGGSTESEAKTVYTTSETQIDAKFAVEGFAGAKAGVEGGYESGSEGQTLKGKAGAFAGLEFSPKTEFVLRANAKELARFKGGLTFTVGLGGEIEGVWQWPGIQGGSMSFKSRGKWALGAGVGWDVDVQIPVPSLMTWLWQNGWEWAKWAAGGIGTGISYGWKGLTNMSWYGMKGLSMAYSGLSSVASGLSDLVVG